jgi:hypothetical protein
MSATITLKFIPNPDGKGDSTLQYLKPETTIKKKITINGWSVSWNADLSSKEIQKVQEDIALPNDVKSALRGYVRDESFLVSSVFCVLEHAQLMNTFVLKTGEGKDLSQGEGATGFIRCLIAWFKIDREPQGTPTPRNPFVLGYGIRQKVPSEPVLGIPLFVPRHFQFTTSTDVDMTLALDDRKRRDKSSLNFAMVTENERRVDLQNDGNAGAWTPSLIVQAGLNRDEADGVMVLSNGIFYNQYIKPYFVEPFKSLGFREEVAKKYPDNRVQLTSGPEVRNGPKMTKKLSWLLKKGAHDTVRRGLLIQERSQWTGNEEFDVTWSGDIPKGEHANNTPRVGSIVVNARAYAEYLGETNTRGGSDKFWEHMTTVYFKAHLRLTFNIYASRNGGWSVQLDESRSFAPSKNKDGKVEYTNAAPGTDGKPGIWGWDYKSGYFEMFGGDGTGAVLSQMGDWNTADITQINNDLEKVYKELQSKIIMPAGNVFQFTGFNVDQQGNVYCPVVYSSISSGEQFKLGVSD